jgi:hypothetical protein
MGAMKPSRKTDPTKKRAQQQSLDRMLEIIGPYLPGSDLGTPIPPTDWNISKDAAFDTLPKIRNSKDSM